MGYSRTINKTITVSGSKTVTYPASQHGGMTTVHFSESVPVSINVYVDTDAFEDSVYRASGKVDLLTGAVVGMEAAQRNEIKRSAEKISEKMIEGFFHLIRSDLSMQQTANRSLLQAKFALLLNLSKDMAQKRERMADDLAKLRRHYSKIFSDMDNDLESRIRKLDSHVFNLTDEIKNTLIVAPYLDQAGAAVNDTQDMTVVNNLLVTARIKEKTADVLNTISDYMDESAEYDQSVSSLMFRKHTDSEEIQYVPVVFCRNNHAGSREDNVYVADIGDERKIQSSVEDYMNTVSENEWHEGIDDYSEKIEDHLLALMGTSANKGDLDERVYQKILNLWNSNKSGIKIL